MGNNLTRRSFLTRTGLTTAAIVTAPAALRHTAAVDEPTDPWGAMLPRLDDWVTGELYECPPGPQDWDLAITITHEALDLHEGERRLRALVDLPGRMAQAAREAQEREVIALFRGGA